MLPGSSINIRPIVLYLVVSTPLISLAWLSTLTWWNGLIILITLIIVSHSILRLFVCYKLPPEPVWVDIITVVFFINRHLLLLNVLLITPVSSHVLHLLLVVVTSALVQSVGGAGGLDLLHLVSTLLLIVLELDALDVSLPFRRELIVLHWLY